MTEKCQASNVEMLNAYLEYGVGFTELEFLSYNLAYHFGKIWDNIFLIVGFFEDGTVDLTLEEADFIGRRFGEIIF